MAKKKSSKKSIEKSVKIVENKIKAAAKASEQVNDKLSNAEVKTAASTVQSAKSIKSAKSTAEINVSKQIIDQVIGQNEAVELVKKAAKQRRHVLLIGDPGTGKCVGAKTRIMTEYGPITAEDLFDTLSSEAIVKDDGIYCTPSYPLNIFSLNENQKIEKKAISMMYKGKKKRALKLETKSGESIILSGDHPVLTANDQGVYFLNAEHLEEGKRVGLIRSLPELSKIKLSIPKGDNWYRECKKSYYKGKNGVKSNPIKIPEDITPDLAYFLGVYAAEGRWQGNIVIYNEDVNIKNKIKKILCEEFDYPETLIEDQETCLFLRKSGSLAFFLHQAFEIPINTKGKKQSASKRVPLRIIQSSSEVIGSFLSGYIDGDGYFGKSGLECVSASEELISGMRTLLLRLAIQSRTGDKIVKGKRYYSLRVFDSDNLIRLGGYLNLIMERKRDKLLKFFQLKSNTNVDVVPGAAKLFLEINENLHLKQDYLEHHNRVIIRSAKGLRNMSREFTRDLFNKLSLYDVNNTYDIKNTRMVQSVQNTGRQILEFDTSQEIQQKIQRFGILANSDLFWDTIKSIEIVEDDVYDFEVLENHNFIASNFVVHNSMLGLALAELLPKEKLVDIIAYPNANDENQPLIRTVPAGKARDIIFQARTESNKVLRGQNIFMFVLAILAMVAPFWARSYYKSDVIFAAFLIGGMIFLGSVVLMMNLGKRMGEGKISIPKVVVDNFGKKTAPFHDATGAHAGALLGDVLHDPFQSGGLGTPAHERVIAGMIHKANLGVLFIDEIGTLDQHTQQELLTALQEGKFPITGQSERSEGAMVRTEQVPCAFILVAAGNLETIKKMHPALRSRIRGYGYEIYMKDTIKDTSETRDKFKVFIAQEVVKDKKIPHFSNEAVEEIITIARRMASRKGHLTLRLRELGGIIRAAGDIAKEENAEFVKKDHIAKARKLARTLEQQIADKYIERKREYEVIRVEGSQIGRVNGMAVIGSDHAFSGIILPIEAEVTEGGKQKEIIATGKLGEIAKEAIKNVSAIIKKYFGSDLRKYDIHVQFLQTYEGVEGDSASIAVATTIISALKKVPIKQNISMTGSLSVRGEVLPIGGVTSKIEAAIEAGLKKVIVPASNMNDIVLEKDQLAKIEIIPVKNIAQVLEEALDWKGHEEILKKIKAMNGNY